MDPLSVALAALRPLRRAVGANVGQDRALRARPGQRRPRYRDNRRTLQELTSSTIFQLRIEAQFGPPVHTTSTSPGKG